jgi:hypothetical protein
MERFFVDTTVPCRIVAIDSERDSLFDPTEDNSSNESLTAVSYYRVVSFCRSTLMQRSGESPTLTWYW